MQITVSVNGVEHTRDVEPRLLLVHFLRDELGLTGTHWGCDTSNCGTCVVLMDGEPVKSCTVLAATAERYEITTVEGLERDGVLDPVQQGFHEKHGLQCGFCTSGMMLTARALLDRNPDPTDEEIRVAISGQICRCTGYATIVRSIRWAAEHPTTRCNPKVASDGALCTLRLHHDSREFPMHTPPIVSPEEWEAARQQLLVKEKELTRARDALAAERRRMPWLAVEQDTRSRGRTARRACSTCSTAAAS